jgi:hypothetical protein
MSVIDVGPHLGHPEAFASWLRGAVPAPADTAAGPAVACRPDGCALPLPVRTPPQ